MDELLWQNNIKDLIYPNLSKEEFEDLIQDITQLYLNSFLNGVKVWCDITYLNTCLLLLFAYFKKVDNPLQVFYALIFHNIVEEPSANRFLVESNMESLRYFMDRDLTYPICNSKTTRSISFLISQEEFIPNDFNVTENEFNILKDIILYASHDQIKPNIWSGLSYKSDHGLSFKFKGAVQQDQLKSFVLPILSIMKKKSFLFNTPFLKELYNNRINFILDEYSNLKFKG